MNYTRLIMAWTVFFIMVGMVVWTIMAYRKDPVDLTRRNRVLFIGGLGLYLMLKIPMPFALNWYWLVLPLDLIRLTLFTALLSVTVRWLRQRRKK